MNYESNQSQDNKDEYQLFEQLKPTLTESKYSEDGISVFSIYDKGTPNEICENVSRSFDKGVCRVRGFADGTNTIEIFNSEGKRTSKTTSYTDEIISIEERGSVYRVETNGDTFLVSPGGADNLVAQGIDEISVGDMFSDVQESIPSVSQLEKLEVDKYEEEFSIDGSTQPQSNVDQQLLVPLDIFVNDF